MGTVIVKHEYPSLPGSDVYSKTVLARIGKEGNPIMEDLKLIDCPDCGEALKVLQHPGTADGLPFVTCGDACPGDAPLMVIDYE